MRMDRESFVSPPVNLCYLITGHYVAELKSTRVLLADKNGIVINSYFFGGESLRIWFPECNFKKYIYYSREVRKRKSNG